MTLSAKHMELFETIKACAENDEPCPKNIEICAMYGFSSGSSARWMIERLERAGLIRVFRKSRSRMVEIIATGQRTRHAA